MEATETRILLERLLGQYVVCAGKVSLKSARIIQEASLINYNIIIAFRLLDIININMRLC